jgi:hypothetical protein
VVHKVFLAESAAGLITQYEVLKGDPVDEVHVAPSIRRDARIPLATFLLRFTKKTVSDTVVLEWR